MGERMCRDSSQQQHEVAKQAEARSYIVWEQAAGWWWWTFAVAAAAASVPTTNAIDTDFAEFSAAAAEAEAAARGCYVLATEAVERLVVLGGGRVRAHASRGQKILCTYLLQLCASSLF